MTAIAAGDSHSLALRSDGTVFAWGSNLNGQLGNAGAAIQPTPSQVAGLSNISAIAAGQSHSMALVADGTVRAWGYNAYGQLGNSSIASSGTPVTVGTLANIKAISAGGNFGLALSGNGTVYSWGDNRLGQLGNSGTPTSYTSPVPVSDSTNVTAVAAGFQHGLALTAGGAVYSWGDNSYGQLGNGSNVGSTTPVQVLGLANVTKIAAGYYHNLAYEGNGLALGMGLEYLRRTRQWFDSRFECARAALGSSRLHVRHDRRRQ